MSDEVGGTVLRDRERLEPSEHMRGSEDDGMEEAPSARWDPRLGYESARLEGFEV